MAIARGLGIVRTRVAAQVCRHSRCTVEYVPISSCVGLLVRNLAHKFNGTRMESHSVCFCFTDSSMANVVFVFMILMFAASGKDWIRFNEFSTVG